MTPGRTCRTSFIIRKICPAVKHTTPECTLRGFTCVQVNVDPKVATPAEIQKMRARQTGHQVEGITGGLKVKDPKDPK